MKREFLIKSEQISHPKYGKYPGARSTEELIKRGIVLLDKPSGPTSHQVTAWLKKILEIEKAGHSGTLDPKTSGLLLVALEKSTKTMPVLKGLDKEYISVIYLHEDVEQDKLNKALEKFRGKIKQTPPKKSAVKRRERVREIKELDLIEREARKLLVKINCEAGTYIRKLAHNLGEELGTGAHMKELRRTKIGPFSVENASNLYDIKDNYTFHQENENKSIRKNIIPVEMVAEACKTITVKDTAIESLCQGAPLGLGGISRLEKGIEKDDSIAMLSLKGELIAIGEAEMSAEEMKKNEGGKAVSLKNVIMERGTYPQGWK